VKREGLIARGEHRPERAEVHELSVDSISRGAFESRRSAGAAGAASPTPSSYHRGEHDERARRSIEQREEQRMSTEHGTVCGEG
jgi:hypothetical protein